MREIRSSGSVRGGVGNDPAYSAGRLADPWLVVGCDLVELGEAAIGIGLQDAAEALQMRLRVLAHRSSGDDRSDSERNRAQQARGGRSGEKT
jgi:hypothetical protein